MRETGVSATNSCFLDVDDLWEEIRAEALHLAGDEPRLASSLHATVIGHSSLCSCLSFLLSNKLSSATLLPVHLQSLIDEVYREHDEVTRACRLDIEAVRDRDPACFLYSQCLMFYKGFLAIQAQRVAHCLWNDGRKPLATLLQSRISDVFHVDIHPGATIGSGIFVDHATGVVIGEVGKHRPTRAHGTHTHTQSHTHMHAEIHVSVRSGRLRATDICVCSSCASCRADDGDWR